VCGPCLQKPLTATVPKDSAALPLSFIKDAAYKTSLTERRKIFIPE
jgi:hypothetical protein